MMAEQKYKRNLIRMFDGLRAAEYKGDECCSGIRCADCPFSGKVCKKDATDAVFNAHEAIKIVEQWVEEHPVQTNAEKFKEVFSVDPRPIIYSCLNFNTTCANCKYYNGSKCSVSNSFWNAEYKE